MTTEQPLPAPEGPEYIPCACGHIEPEHREQRPGWTREACLNCACVDYAPPVPESIPVTTEPTSGTAPAGDRLFALVASIPGSGSVDWCGPARALLDEVRADAAAVPVVVPRADRAAGAAASPAIRRKLRQWAYAAGHIESELDGAVDRMYALIAQDVAPVLLPATDRVTTLQEAADRLWALANRTTERGAGVLWAAEWLHRLAGEARQPLCAECDHPKHVHIEGEGPVTPGTCADCQDDDAHHDYEARQDPTPDRETGPRKSVEYFVQSQQPDGTWECGSSYSTAPAFAADRLAARRRMMPDLTLRLAERTTTVVVRALPDCLACRHWKCDGDGLCGALLNAWQRCTCTGPAVSSGQPDTEPLHGESVAHIAGPPGTDTEA